MKSKKLLIILIQQDQAQ